MASISLPRVLTQRRGGPIEVERENFWKAQTTSITKAINNQENPVKEKHVRSAIIGTYHERGATTFWAVVATLPLQGNPIICWKFCHTLHKLLREGHPTVIGESLQYRPRIAELGKYWGYLKESFGKLISCYCRLLANRLEFHSKNPKFPGNLQLNDEQLESIGEMDVNNFFQITVEMFDYMDEILTLQSAVFGSLEMGRANSMTSSGQCRLAPLIPCIQDSSHLYDYLVKLLFKLHSSLPPDILLGHRDRFYKQFKVLREFYRSASVLQYFKHLIQIPLLPEEPPNFLVKSDLSSHVSPVVILPPQEEEIPDNDSMEFTLVDTSASPTLLDIEPTNGTSSPDISEKDSLIEQLRREIYELKCKIQRITDEDQQIIAELQRQSTSLDAYIKELQQQLRDKQAELEMLQLKAVAVAENSEAVAKLTEFEKKSKANEDKFLKMKSAYTKLREEHIVLLRSKADVEKQLGSAKQAEKTKTEWEEKSRTLESEKEAIERVFKDSVEQSAMQISSMTETQEELRREKTALEEKLALALAGNVNMEQTLRQNQEQAALELVSVTREHEQLCSQKKDLEKEFASISQAKQELETALQESARNAAEQSISLEKLRTDHGTLKQTLEETTKQLADVAAENERLRIEQEGTEKKLATILEYSTDLKKKLEKSTQDVLAQSTAMAMLQSELDIKKKELDEQIHKLATEKEASEEILKKTTEQAAEQQGSLMKSLEVSEKEKTDLKKQLDSVCQEKSKLEEQSKADADVMTRLKEEQTNLANAKKEVEQQLQKVTSEKITTEQLLHQNAQKAAEEMAEILRGREELQNDKIALQEKVQMLLHEKSNVEQTMQQSMATSKQKLALLVKEKEDLDGSNKEFDELLFQALDEKLLAEQEMQSKEEEYTNHVQTLTKERNDLQKVIADLEAKVASVSYEKCTTELTLLQNSESLQQQITELLNDKERLEQQVRDLVEQISTLTTDNATLRDTVDDLTGKVSKLEAQVLESKKEVEDGREKSAKDYAEQQFALLVGCIEEAENIVQNALNEIDSPATATLHCPPEYLLKVSSPLPELLDRLQKQHATYAENPKDLESLLKSVAGVSHFLGQLLVHGKATTNNLPDVEQGDKLTEACRISGKDALQLLASMKMKGSDSQVPPNANKVRSDVETVREMTEALIALQASKVEDKIEDLVDKELADMDRAIEEAASRIAAILEKSRAADTGIKLEVSEKILDTCTALMQSIKVLVKRSKEMQTEILAQGKGSASVKEFYKRNHQWTEGLISAAKAVGIGAKFLVDAADKVVSGQAKFETLMAASQEIAASTAQLVVASKVKANPGSDNLRQLSKASNDVRGCTGTVVATVKDCAQMMEDSDVMDFGNLTLHQAKRLEMESHVRVLELESNLEKERVKFSALRKKHYALAGPGEGWEEGDGETLGTK